MIKLKTKSKSVNNIVLSHLSKMLGLQNAFTFDPLLLFEGTSTERTATFSSSAAPRETLPLDVLRSTVAPAKR